MSGKQIVVTVKNISKVYKLYHKPFDRVKEAFSFKKKNYHKKFHALNNVTLELKRGEALGIIGRNGNGKSTLLKIIAKVLTPTHGKVHTTGRVSAILELTSNLKAEMTGRQNIVYNLKIQGFTSKKDIHLKTKEIEEFADIGEFIDQPVKVYSSGMKSRLGFGIATSVEPDILILDEVLAVGDFNFQQKCLAKINGMRENISMIFVSHSMNSVRLFCDRVIVLDKGNLAFNGKSDDAIAYYLEQEEKKKNKLKEKSKKPVKPFYGDLFHNKEKISNIVFSWSKNTVDINEKISLKISFDIHYKINNLVIGIPIWTESGDYITGMSTEMKNYKPTLNNGRYELECSFNNILNPGTYVSVISINDGAETLARILNHNMNSKNTKNRFFGFISMHHEWLPKKEIQKEIKINDILFTVNSMDKSGLSYDGKSSYEEFNTKLYYEIQEKYNPKQVFDIGANYGFTGIVFAKAFPNSKLILIEASSDLCLYIEKNLSNNIENSYKVLNAICAEVANESRQFSLNPSGSQDNRVIAENEKWSKETVTTISLNKLFAKHKSNFYFIKIDTQGYKENVFNGGYEYLIKHNNWIIKTEFAPYWLESQGTNPIAFLKKLVTNFCVVESPMRGRFKNDSLNDILKNPIQENEIENFINYIVKHNKNNRGWCDLFVYPKGLKL